MEASIMKVMIAIFILKTSENIYKDCSSETSENSEEYNKDSTEYNHKDDGDGYDNVDNVDNDGECDSRQERKCR